MQRVDGKSSFVELNTPFGRRAVTLLTSVVAALNLPHHRQTFERVLAGDRWQE
jgi:hypothetical protein